MIKSDLNNHIEMIKKKNFTKIILHFKSKILQNLFKSIKRKSNLTVTIKTNKVHNTKLLRLLILIRSCSNTMGRNFNELKNKETT